MDKSVVSMQDLFKRLNNQGIDLKISNFSKASKHRDPQVFLNLLELLKRQLRQQKGKAKARSLFPIDSTIVTLTSKLLWSQGYHQVKLFCGLDNWTSELGGIVIHFGQGHDHKYGKSKVGKDGREVDIRGLSHFATNRNTSRIWENDLR